MQQKFQYQSSFSSKSSHSYAPFGSVSPRLRKKKKGQLGQELGPGAYDISLPIIKPLIQTIKKKNNNIIVKLSHVGTSSFLGDSERFQNQNLIRKSYEEQVGPGLYFPQKSLAILQNSPLEKSAYGRQKLPKRKQAGIEITKFIKNRQRKAATFSEVKKISIEDYVQMPIVAEDSIIKQVKNSKLNKIKGPAWSMMKQQRIKSIKNPYQNIGPGQYYHNGNQQKLNPKRLRSISEHYPSSYFRSESVRSFFDNICFETNQQKKAILRQAGGYKSNSLGPGSYDAQSKNLRQNKFQFFGSTEQRKLI